MRVELDTIPAIQSWEGCGTNNDCPRWEVQKKHQVQENQLENDCANLGKN